MTKLIESDASIYIMNAICDYQNVDDSVRWDGKSRWGGWCDVPSLDKLFICKARPYARLPPIPPSSRKHHHASLFFCFFYDSLYVTNHTNAP